VSQRVGFFRKFYPDHPSLPLLRDHMRPEPAESEPEIVGYLRAGHMLAAVMEGMVDYFDGTPFEGGSGCSSLLTDGIFLWRQDLAHYVERYHVDLPTDFVRALVDAEFRMPELSPDDMRELAESEWQSRGRDWWALP
jgi:hypothetical protein